MHRRNSINQGVDTIWRNDRSVHVLTNSAALNTDKHTLYDIIKVTI